MNKRVVVNFVSFDNCCDRPNPSVRALLLSKGWPRAKLQERITQSLSRVQFVQECESCGATWFPVEVTQSHNILAFKGVLVTGCL